MARATVGVGRTRLKHRVVGLRRVICGDHRRIVAGAIVVLCIQSICRVRIYKSAGTRTALGENRGAGVTLRESAISSACTVGKDTQAASKAALPIHADVLCARTIDAIAISARAVNTIAARARARNAGAGSGSVLAAYAVLGARTINTGAAC